MTVTVDKRALLGAVKAAALHYAQKMSLKVIPIRTDITGSDADSMENKKPFKGIGSYDASCDPVQVGQWFDRWPGANVAISTGKINNLVVIDIDKDDDKGENGFDILQAWEAENGKLPDTLTSITGRGGNHMIYRMTDKYNGYGNAQMKTDDGSKALGVDIRGEGGYFVAPPSIHKNGRAYEWDAGTIAGDDVELSDIAEVDQTVDSFIRYVYAHTGKAVNSGGDGAKQRFEVPEMIPEGARTDTLFKLTCSLISKGLAEDTIRAAVKSENEARCDPPLANRELEKEVFTAFRRNYEPSAPYTSKKRTEGIAVEKLVKQLTEIDAYHNFAKNELGSARLFATIFRDINRYNPSRRDWMIFDGIRWVKDPEGMQAKYNAKHLTDALIRYASAIEETDENRQAYIKYACSLLSCNKRDTMVKDSRDQNFFSNEELDADDYVINLQNGLLDLHGSEPVLLEHNADQLVSKVANVKYDPDATCPLWEKTVNEIFQGDEEEMRYLQKLYGLSLTGDTSEEKFWDFHGPESRNGKSTVCETYEYVLGDYAATISPDSLAVKFRSNASGPSPDIAKTAGIRFLVSSEPQKNLILDCALIKSLTGGDTITARFLHENNFDFIPKFKLIINTNHLPKVTDMTIFQSDRAAVIPFNRHFNENERDLTLKSRLKKEGSGILNWALEGLRLYRREGLKPPQCIRQAIATYANDSDKIKCFMRDCMVEQAGHNVSIKDAYSKYVTWCHDSGYGVESKSTFISDVKSRGLYADTGTIDGRTQRRVIKGYALENEFVPVDDLQIPF